MLETGHTDFCCAPWRNRDVWFDGMKTTLKISVLCAVALFTASVYSCERGGGDEPAIIEAPADLAVSDIYFDGATLRWSPVQGITTYQVRVNSGIEIDITSTQYVVAGLEAETSQNWEVRSRVDDKFSEWVSGPAFHTTAVSLAPPRNLTVVDRHPFGATLLWDEFPLECSYKIRVQGEFNDEKYPYISSLIDPRTGEFTDTWDKEEGSAIDLKPVLFPQNTYTWQVAVIIEGEQSAWAEGPAFTTKRKFTPEDFTGRYSATGKPSYMPAPGASEWSGEITSEADVEYPGAGWLHISNGYNSDGTTYDVSLDYELEGQVISVTDGRYPLAEAEMDGKRVYIYQVGVFYADGNIYHWQPPGWMAVTDWDADTGTIAYPKLVHFDGAPFDFDEGYGMGTFEVMWGLWAASNQGVPADPVTEFYKDITLTIDRQPGGTRASLTGTRVEMDGIAPGRLMELPSIEGGKPITKEQAGHKIRSIAR